MDQRISLVTLGVSDYRRAKTFYEALGWTAALDVEETAFFTANGVVLVLWTRDKLADDIGIADDGARWGGIALAHNVGSRQEVHDLIEQARGHGAEITREPSVTFYGGDAGAFRGLDGHAWGGAPKPSLRPHDDGKPRFPPPRAPGQMPQGRGQ